MRRKVSSETMQRAPDRSGEATDLAVGPEPTPEALERVDPAAGGVEGLLGVGAVDDDVSVGPHRPEAGLSSHRTR